MLCVDTSNFVRRDLVFRVRDEDTSGNSDSPARTGFFYFYFLLDLVFGSREEHTPGISDSPARTGSRFFSRLKVFFFSEMNNYTPVESIRFAFIYIYKIIHTNISCGYLKKSGESDPGGEHQVCFRRILR
jgi:hypothetical protein